jgi:uncharacterized membrane protein YphA (DoxX/SURF4 family)
MQAIAPGLAKYTTVYMRLALGSTFLAAVMDRFGLWGPSGTRNVAWGNFDAFLAYTAQLNPYLPTAWIPTLGWIVTLAEVACGLALIVGFQTRRVAVVSGLLLLAFALGMTMGLGIKAPLNFSDSIGFRGWWKTCVSNRMIPPLALYCVWSEQRRMGS